MSIWWILDSAERRSRLAREGGWKRVVERELRNRLLRARHHGRPQVFEGALADVRHRPLPPGIRIEPFGGDEWDRLRSLTGRRTRALFRRRAAAGRTAVVAWRDAAPVGICWLTDRIDPALEGQRFDLSPGTVYTYGLFVTPGERRKGIAAALIQATMRLAAERGFERYRFVVYEGNRSAVRASERAYDRRLGPVFREAD